jgi:integrase
MVDGMRDSAEAVSRSLHQAQQRPYVMDDDTHGCVRDVSTPQRHDRCPVPGAWMRSHDRAGNRPSRHRHRRRRSNGYKAGSAATIRLWFHRLYQTLGMTGCSLHSGRRTFITRAARKVSEVGGSVRDVQQLAGHASMQTTQRYIEGVSDAKRKLVGML